MTNAFDNIGWNDDFSGATRLPFQTVTLRVLNGDAKMKGVKPDARYFGGWAYDSDNAAKLIADGDLRTDPAWPTYEATGEKGDYRESANRVAQVAVIKGRMRWTNDKTRQYGVKYFQGARMHVQYLAGLFKLDKGVVEFAGMATLTAKGHQAGHLQTAIETYANYIRSATAGEPSLSRLPRPSWILTIGTTGDKPEFVQVGKTQTSAITPIKAILPKAPEELSKRRVTDEVIQHMANCYAQAGTWLDAWKQGAEAQPVAQHEAEPEGEYVEQPF